MPIICEYCEIGLAMIGLELPTIPRLVYLCSKCANGQTIGPRELGQLQARLLHPDPLRCIWCGNGIGYTTTSSNASVPIICTACWGIERTHLKTKSDLEKAIFERLSTLKGKKQ